MEVNIISPLTFERILIQLLCSSIIFKGMILHMKKTVASIISTVIWQHFNLDGEIYLVTDVFESPGLYQITPGANMA